MRTRELVETGIQEIIYFEILLDGVSGGEQCATLIGVYRIGSRFNLINGVWWSRGEVRSNR